MLTSPANLHHFFSHVTDHRLLPIEKWIRALHFLSVLKAIGANSTQPDCATL
jgi:hypothetical protein